MFPKDTKPVREESSCESELFSTGMIDRAFKEFLDPTIEVLRYKYPLIRTFNVAVYIRIPEYTTFPSIVVARAPFCEIGREKYSLFWKEVSAEAPNRGYEVEKFPSEEHPYVFSFTKIFED